METEIFKIIDEEIEKCDADLIRLTSRFIKIKSVRSKARKGAPFGKGAKKMLDVFIGEAKKSALLVKDYKIGFCSAALREGEVDLGIWLHGDVVPEGTGWIYPPYRPTLLDGYIVGRGATDNKGQLAAVITLFNILKKTGNLPRYNAAIFVGSAEETGMDDLFTHDGSGGFLSVARPPKLSLVPDADFPICNAGSGSTNLLFRSGGAISSCDIIAGTEKEPGVAHAIFKSVDEKTIPSGIIAKKIAAGTDLSAFKPPRHASSPDPDGNMITLLFDALLDNNFIREDERKYFQFLRDITKDIHGELLQINTEHEKMRPLTVFTKDAATVNGKLEFSLNVRYPVGITEEEILTRVSSVAENFDFTVESHPVRNPYIIDDEDECAKILCNISNEITGDNRTPYAMGGATYAHHLPNAYPFGMSGNKIPDFFPKGHGEAHGPDEVVSIERLKRAMKIYARAIIRLNDYFKSQH